MKRVFLGVDLAQEIKQVIEDLKVRNRLDKLPIKLVELENSHIAIKFFGDLSDEQIKIVNQAVMIVVRDFKYFEVTIKDSLVFPNIFQPRVLALKIISSDLQVLAQKIFAELDKLGFVETEQRKYTAHITLGRIKDKLTDLEKEKIAGLKFEDRLIVSAIQLFESQLTSDGPIYTILKEFKSSFWRESAESADDR